jgi:hypothetical protein
MVPAHRTGNAPVLGTTVMRVARANDLGWPQPDEEKEVRANSIACTSGSIAVRQQYCASESKPMLKQLS